MSTAMIRHPLHDCLARYAFCSPVWCDQLPAIDIKHPGFSARLLLQGAQLLSFQPNGQADWLWLSPKAEYKHGVSVRGGIPICWPWFGNADKNPSTIQHEIVDVHQAPAHGFARQREWQLTDVIESTKHVQLNLALLDTTSTDWHTSLSLHLNITFSSEQLTLELITTNNNTKEVAFSQALHTYFPTDDIHRTYINGTHKVRYIDALDQWQQKHQSGAVTFSGETDRIYLASGPFQLNTPSSRRTLTQVGSHSAVIWNPGIEKSKRLSQFPNDGWQTMFCVETANAADDVIVLQPGKSHRLVMQLS